jgi:hypothetical protein
VILNQRVGKELEGDAAPKAGILRFVNDSHTPAPQLAQDAVMRDSLANHRAAPPVSGVMLGRERKEVNRAADERGKGTSKPRPYGD